jgi:hypothetical protein
MLPTIEPTFAAEPTTEERRDARRYVVSWGSFCRLKPWPESRPERVLLHDISALGLGLVFADPPTVGTVLALQLPTGRPGVVRWTTAEVRQVTQLADRIWVAGCALAEPLSPEDVQGVLDSADVSP